MREKRGKKLCCLAFFCLRDCLQAEGTVCARLCLVRVRVHSWVKGTQTDCGLLNWWPGFLQLSQSALVRKYYLKST